MKKNRKSKQQKRIERNQMKRKRRKKETPDMECHEDDTFTFYFHDEETNECFLAVTVHKLDENSGLPLFDGETSEILDLN